MKKFLFSIAFLAISMVAFSQNSTMTNGYIKSNGNYVAPHYKTEPDKTTYNNFSTQGNYNPYNGQSGTKSPTYQGTQPIETGSRGGQYYINSNGNKTYIKRN